MTDNQTTSGGTPGGTEAQPTHAPFPWTRLFYAIGFAIVAWFVFWLVLILAMLQFVTTAISGQENPELKTISQSVIQYLSQILAFVTLGSDEHPFPLGPFPKA